MNQESLKAIINNDIKDLVSSTYSELEVDSKFINDSLSIPPDQTMGDLSFPCFQFSKGLKLAPNKIAEELMQKFNSKKYDWLEKADIKGGFLNFFLNPISLAKYLVTDIHNSTFFSHAEKANEHQKIMIEYSQPNTHKDFHVGHVRNVCLGDSLVRLYRYCSNNVIAANYIGDEGTHIAKCLWQVMLHKDQIPTSNQADWYGQMYLKANLLINDADKEKKAEINNELSSILAKLESKEGDYYELWKTSRQECLENFDNIYKELDVNFDHVFYESELTDECQEIVKENIEKGIFNESSGAYGIDLSDDKLGFLMVRKSDGNSLYITKDMALAKRKFEDFNIDQSIYVVADEQAFHFKQLFRGLEIMGHTQAKNSYHLSYAMVVRPDGKMSSRLGNIFTYKSLKETIKTEIYPYLDKYKESWSQEEIENTVELITLGTIKHGMLSMDPNKKIIFDPKDWVSFEGNTGVYAMYAYARALSIIQKAGDKYNPDYIISGKYLEGQFEKSLMIENFNFNTAATRAARTYRPSVLVNHLYELAKKFNRFYTEVPILKSENLDEVNEKLALVNTFALTMEKGLNLLGIIPPKKL